MGIIYVFVSRNEAVTILAGFHFNIFRGDLRASSERGNSAELDLKGHLTNSES